MYNICTEKFKYRGVEQLVARRAHNPKVVGSSPASATKTKDARLGVFFVLIMVFDFEPTTKGYEHEGRITRGDVATAACGG